MLPLVVAFVLDDLVFLGFVLARAQVNDLKTPLSKDLFPFGAQRRAMAIWAHPDDEITSAGTLAEMARVFASTVQSRSAFCSDGKITTS